MSFRHVARSAIALAMAIGSLAGCRFYWSKDGGTAEAFNRDSLECAKESSPTPQAAKYGIPTEKIYKACLQHRGWVRENTTAGEGKFRGIEDWD